MVMPEAHDGPGDAKCWNPKRGKFKSMLSRIGKKIRSSFTKKGKEPHRMTTGGGSDKKMPTGSGQNPNRMGAERIDPSGKDPKQSKHDYNKKKIRSY